MNTNIYTKLHQIQSKLNHLTKTEENKFQHYKYVSEYQILTILKPLLTESKLTLTFSDEITLTKYAENSISYDDENLTNLYLKKEDKEWIVKYLKKAVLTNTENPEETLIYHFWVTGQNTDIAKAKGSAETYAVKYFLQKLFLIPTSDNLDPDKIGGKKELIPEEKKQVEEVLARHKLKDLNSPYGKN